MFLLLLATVVTGGLGAPVPAADSAAAAAGPAKSKPAPAQGQEVKKVAAKSATSSIPDLPPSKDTELAAAIAKWKKTDWETLVQEDQSKFLQQLRQKCSETITDFTATFLKQERISGELRDQETADMKWRAKPFSVYMKYTEGDKGREALYVEGQHDNKLLVHPGGFLGPLIQIQLAPDAERVMKDNLRPITAAGMTNMLSAIVSQCELAKKNGDLKLEYLGKTEVGGRKVYTIKRTLPQKKIYPCKELVIFIDCDTITPLGTDAYDWDGQLLSKYRYNDLKLNPGLTDDDFDRGNKNYNF
jgi:hypothetical protein